MPLAERAPAPELDDPAWMSAGQAARRLQVAAKTVRRYCRDGSLPFTAVKIGGQWRILRADVEAVRSSYSADGTAAVIDGAGE